MMDFFKRMLREKMNFGSLLHRRPIIHANLPFTQAPNMDKKGKEIQAKVEIVEDQGKVAIEAERRRIAEIDEIACLYDPKTVHEAKYGENPCTAGEMAFLAAKKESHRGAEFIAALKADHELSGAMQVAVISSEDELPSTPEQRFAQGQAYAAKLQRAETTQGGSNNAN